MTKISVYFIFGIAVMICFAGCQKIENDPPGEIFENGLINPTMAELRSSSIMATKSSKDVWS
ncbi:MAG: hypothetical protein U5Q03_12605 [Bacteroidota bacterium]|nr:hypothetical protein [Bacteroidota bacterium]